MYSENGVLVDFEQVNKLIAEADVFAIGFANFPERLLIDARSNDSEIPLVQIVEPMGSAKARLSWLRRRRPSLAAPENFSFFSWPHSPGFLMQSGLWERICRRVEADYHPDVAIQCDLAMQQLENMDDAAAQSVLKGDHCLTLWPRDPEDDR